MVEKPPDPVRQVERHEPVAHLAIQSEIDQPLRQQTLRVDGSGGDQQMQPGLLAAQLLQQRQQ